MALLPSHPLLIKSGQTFQMTGELDFNALFRSKFSRFFQTFYAFSGEAGWQAW